MRHDAVANVDDAREDERFAVHLEGYIAIAEDHREARTFDP
jgi:hypothetical protein